MKGKVSHENDHFHLDWRFKAQILSGRCIPSKTANIALEYSPNSKCNAETNLHQTKLQS